MVRDSPCPWNAPAGGPSGSDRCRERGRPCPARDSQTRARLSLKPHLCFQEAGNKGRSHGSRRIPGFWRQTGTVPPATVPRDAAATPFLPLNFWEFTATCTWQSPSAVTPGRDRPSATLLLSLSFWEFTVTCSRQSHRAGGRGEGGRARSLPAGRAERSCHLRCSHTRQPRRPQIAADISIPALGT